LKLSHFETNIRFSERTKVATPAFSIFRELTGKEDYGGDKPSEPGVRIRDEEKLWQIATCSEKYWLGSAWWYIINEDLYSQGDKNLGKEKEV